MSNRIRPATPKLLKIGFCGFCYFVRGRGGKTAPCTRMGTAGNTLAQNNKNNRIIYINRIAGDSVTGGGIL
jgi:hypothetical protein